MRSSAEKAFALLRVVVRSEVPLSLMEIAREAGLDKSTASRLLRTLQELQYVERDEKSKAYAVGAGFLAIATSAIKQSRLLRLASPYLRQIAEATGASTGLYLLVGSGRVCADVVQGENVYVPVYPKGEPISLLNGASSMAILAFQSPEFRQSIYDIEQVEADRIPTLEAELKRVTTLRYCEGTMLRAPEVATLSVPISQNSRVIGSMTIFGHTARISDDDRTKHIPLLLEACSNLSLALSSSDYAFIAPQLGSSTPADFG